MNDAAAEIERIVQKVLAELRASGMASLVEQIGHKRDAAPVMKPEPPAVANDNRVITERVITLATLDGRLNGASMLTVPCGAVITPAVRDELKSRSIRLEFADAKLNEKPAVTVELLVGIADVADDVSAMAKMIQDHVAGIAAVQSMQQTDLRALTVRMAEWLASRPSLAVLLTRRPAAAACLANRHRGLRAACASTPKALAEAMSTMAPNVITYNPADHAMSAQRAMLREFARGGVRGCPEEFNV